MSPSEDQLRAALRAGEGGTPDPDVIIGQALQVKHQQHQRRVRLVSVAAAVLVVGGLGVGIGALTRSGDNGSSGSTANAGTAYGDSLRGSVSAPDANAPIAPVPASVAGSTTGAASGVTAGGADGSGGSGGSAGECPATPVRYALAGGGGTNQFGAGDSLFSGPVASILVCRYSSTAGSPLSSAQTLTGADATRAAAALDAAPSQQSSELSCLVFLNIELIPTGTNGTAMTPISVVGQCSDAMVTNGTAVRYAPLTTYGFEATPPPSSGLQSGGGTMAGSPPR